MVRHIPCGPFANKSEWLALERLRNKLQPAQGLWVLLSNLDHSRHAGARSDEIDCVAIGPSGVTVIEVKHWDAAYLRQHPEVVEREADRVNAKTRRVAGKLRPRLEVGLVEGRLLLTRGEVRFDDGKRPRIRGVDVFGLPEWSELVAAGGYQALSDQQVELAARLLEPTVKLALTGDLRAFGGLINLERLSPKAESFHRVYRGQHPTRRDRVVLHLFDLSARDERQSLALARREYDSIQRWQKSPFVPSLLDSFQEAEGYPGELYFYSLVDPAAATLAERARDLAWDAPARLAFARSALAALRAFHRPDDPDLTAICHRRISPTSLRVRHNNQPLFTDFSLARLADGQTLADAQVDLAGLGSLVAPEVRHGGVGAADARSDVFALCATLLTLFDGEGQDEIRAILSRGLSDSPDERAPLEDLIAEVDRLRTPSAGDPGPVAAALPGPEFWDEDTVVPFKDSRFKILGRLGQGGVGQTFKVVEIDTRSDEKFGTYVAKLVRDAGNGEAAIRAYRQVRAYTTHPNLSTIHEIAPEWAADRFVALMKWVEGMPLSDLAGVLPLYAEDLGETDPQDLARRWLLDLCAALNELHRAGLVHGDVSPRNLIVQGGQVVLTDYDTVTSIGTTPRGGTIPFASPSVQARTGVQPADDLYALAASLFQVFADREPFLYGAERRKDLGLNWDGITGWEGLKPFLDRATHPDAGQRFADAFAAREFLAALARAKETLAGDEDAASNEEEVVVIRPPTLTPNQVPWLTSLLSSYPGSPHGNSEARGLDTEFAERTYVETGLDEILFDRIQAGEVNLVILFGNAGDGKTAFLQHLAKRLGLADIHSSRRVWETGLANGQRLMVNLDGAAAWEGRRANQLLSQLFEPFHTPDFPRDRVHIVAVNNGKLLEWIESQPEATWLTAPLRRVLLGEEVDLTPRFTLIDLNRRSLVGGIDRDQGSVATGFLDALLTRFLGTDADPWEPCRTCTAQGRCTAWHSVQTLRDPELGPRVRARLARLLQACHQRGEIHITARELRGALSYCLFGVHDCAELHADPDLAPPHLWQRAFDAHSAYRQGELLAEMLRFDPALDADPVLDRILLHEARARAWQGGLAESRRRAWFLRGEREPGGAIRLAEGLHHARFRDVPLMSPGEREALLRDLCLGIARLEDLPPLAFADAHLARGVPMRITPRTPTDSAFWVVKSWERFGLKPLLPVGDEGLEVLHTHLALTYHYAGGDEEALLLGLELFHLLLALKDGAQLSGIAEEGVFANLEIFTQRLAEEDPRELYGWHPAEDEQIFRVRVLARDGRQVLVREVV